MRNAKTYRAARRNSAKRHVWRGHRPKGRLYVAQVALNRSKRLPRAASYADARGIAAAALAS